jgi:hypothetical protein
MGAYVSDLVSRAHRPKATMYKVLLAVAKQLSDVGCFDEWHDAAYFGPGRSHSVSIHRQVADLLDLAPNARSLILRSKSCGAGGPNVYAYSFILELFL